MAQHLTDMAISRVSLVDKGANQRRLAVFKREGSMANAKAPAAALSAIAAGIAKGRAPEQPDGILAGIRKALGAGKRVSKSAAANVSEATWALSYVLDLITDESSDLAEDGSTDPDAADDQSDIATLKAVAQGLTTYIAATAQEVGTADDLEDIAEEAAAYAAYCMGDYGVWKSARPIAKEGRKISQGRLDELKSASDKLLAVIADAESGGKKDDEEDTNVEKAEIVAAMAEALAPIEKRLEALEIPKVEKTGEGDGPVTLETIAEAVGKVAERVGALESATSVGKRTSVVGQDGGTAIKKKAVFAGLL